MYIFDKVRRGGKRTNGNKQIPTDRHRDKSLLALSFSSQQHHQQLTLGIQETKGLTHTIYLTQNSNLTKLTLATDTNSTYKPAKPSH